MNRRVVETSELQRMYGEIQNPADAHIAALKEQLTQAHVRETALITEKSKLFELLSAEKEEKWALLRPFAAKHVPAWVRLLLDIFNSTSIGGQRHRYDC